MGDWDAASIVQAAEVLGVQMGWIKPEDCIYTASPSLAGMEKTVTVETDENGVKLEVITWRKEAQP